MRVAWDTENTHLLNEDSIDYTSVPYKLKPDFKMHCIVCKDIDTNEIYTFVQDEIYSKFPAFASKVTHWIGQNSIDYDHLVLKLAMGIDFTIGPDTVSGKSVVIDDLLVMSKTLNPDRFSHSTEYYGKLFKYPKMDWRQEAIDLGLIQPNDPAGAEFKVYHPRMLDYCTIDVEINHKEYIYLKKEWGDWNWSDAYELEKAVADVISRQSHRGFKFDMNLAKANLDELDILMENIRSKVEPSLPPKPAPKTLQKNYIPPKIQFKKDGSLSSNIIKFATKLNGSLEAGTDDSYSFIYEGKSYPLPLPLESFLKEVPMTLADSTQIKEYLVRDFNWVPTSFKERDLTVNTKKQKLTKDKFTETVERYVEQTLASAFCKYRCDHLNVHRLGLREKLLKHDLSKPLKVLTNPSFTIGADKEICTGLIRIGTDYPHAQDIANWLTYRHRRNSILGGGVDYDDEENIEKGYLNFVRSDGRISTPADTCGAGTSRFKHRVVANIPRVTSLYGANMRAMFGVDTLQSYQLGYDFDSLEAKITGHYIWKYEGGPELAEALVASKPNDIHSLNAAKLGIMRNDAKTFFYACVPVEGTEVLTSGGWKKYHELNERDVILSYNPDTDQIEEDEILKLHFFHDREVKRYSNSRDSFLCTEDHRWYGRVRRREDREYFEEGFFEASDITPEHELLVSVQPIEDSSSIFQFKSYMSCRDLTIEDKGVMDVFCLTTGNGTFIIRQEGYLGITGNCLYGAQPAKLAKQLGWSLSRAKDVFEGFWEACLPIKLLKDNLEKYWLSAGQKQFVLGLDGRKIPTRSRHALLNSLFQSGGVICAKRAMVIHDRLLKKEGLNIDFFK